jgi:hypothetical protein
MKPLLIAMKYTGLLPIAFSKSGKFNVRYWIEELADKRGYVTAHYGKVYFIIRMLKGHEKKYSI